LYSLPSYLFDSEFQLLNVMILSAMHGTVPHSLLTQRSKHFYAASLTSECQVALCSVREANTSTVAARCFIAVWYEVLVQFHGSLRKTV
jgi:hypothetical protein